MIRRLKFFAFGAFLSILFLSMGPENRLRETFIAYIDYFNPEKRVIRQFSLADSIVYNSVNKLEVDSFFKNSWINHELTNKDSYPQLFVLDNIVSDQNQRLYCRYYDMEKRKIDGKLRRYSKVEFYVIDKSLDLQLSSRSYKSYIYLIGIFLFIMIPVSLLVRNLIKKRKLKED